MQAGSCISPKAKRCGLAAVETEGNFGFGIQFASVGRWEVGAVLCRAPVLYPMFSVKTVLEGGFSSDSTFCRLTLQGKISVWRLTAVTGWW